ncbi:response regulator transcription factor [Streptomyces sp. 8K308]|uniref:response regulator transcription factor n=1 Tax=Streptomyces sp. 8K308 TaxID=2530388 RepID=UPI003262CEFA
MAQTLRLRPDVVLMDVRMPEMDGVEAVAILRGQAPECRTVMLTTFDDEEYVVQALRAGASGYLLKDLPADELAHEVRLAHAGVTQLDSSVARRLAAALPPPPGPSAGSPPSGRSGPEVPLSPREIDILRLVARGLTNREIAAELYLSEGTVKNHVSRILSRLALRDHTQRPHPGRTPRPRPRPAVTTPTRRPLGRVVVRAKPWDTSRGWSHRAATSRDGGTP